jgi:hypothetical protein
MKNNKYERARATVFALNRFAKRTVRPRRDERQTHFERDRRTARSLITDSNILGFGVGPKIRATVSAASEFCLVFFVRKKLPRSRLRHSIEIPKQLLLNTTGLTIRTDVQEWEQAPVAHGLLSSGASIGDLAGNSGTMTMAVRDNATGDPLILSCSHVLAAAGRGRLGDQVESPASPGENPGPNVVGHLLRFTRIDPGSLSNAVDAAVADPLTDIDLSNEIPGIGTPNGIRDLTLEGDSAIKQMGVQRAGAVTGPETGTIVNLHVTTRITYRQLPGDPSVYFVDLAQYDAPSSEGDSGAAVTDTTDAHSVVGMHIAGLPDGSASFFTHIRYVFDRMQVEFWDPAS